MGIVYIRKKGGVKTQGVSSGAKKRRFYGISKLSITVKDPKEFVLNENKIAGHATMDSSSRGAKGGKGGRK